MKWLLIFLLICSFAWADIEIDPELQEQIDIAVTDIRNRQEAIKPIPLPIISIPKVYLPRVQIPGVYIPILAIPRVQIPGVYIPILAIPRVQIPMTPLPLIPLSTHLIDYFGNAIDSVNYSWWLRLRDYDKIPDAKLKTFLKGEVELPILDTPPFFIGLGAFKLGEDISEYLELSKLDCLLFYITDYDRQKVGQIVGQIEQSDKQLIIAFDFMITDVGVMELVDKYKDKKNDKGEKVIHSIILLWGMHNTIDIDNFDESARVAKELYAYVKSQDPEMFVWLQVALNIRRIPAYLKKITVGADGVAWWGCQLFPAFEGEAKNKYEWVRSILDTEIPWQRYPYWDKPLLLTFFGRYPSQGWDMSEAKEKWLPFIRRIKAEDWAGCILMTPANWAEILK